MYKLLIIDDEELICEGLKSKINRINHPEIGEVSFSCDPLEGIRIAQREKQDIVITDVKMPEINGIELIRRISAENPATQFIVLSGYDDYQYVRAAFRMGVVDYLLKPVVVNELEERLETAVQRRKEATDTGVDNKRKQLLHQMEQKMHKLFCSSQKYYKESDELIKDIQAVFPYKNFILGLLCYSDSTTHVPNNEDINDHFEEAVKSIFQNSEFRIVVLNDTRLNTVIVINYTAPVEYNKFSAIFQTFLQELKEQSGISATGALSEAHEGAIHLGNLYEQAIHALQYKVVVEPNTVIEFKNIKHAKQKMEVPYKDLNRFFNQIHCQNVGKIGDFIDSTFQMETLRNCNIEDIKLLYDTMLHKTTALVIDQQSILPEEYPRDFYSFFSLNELIYYLKEYIYKTIEKLYKNETREKTVVDIAKRYIVENYQKEISMAEIANLVSVSYTYFSKLFKQETGYTFSEYLKKTRMEEAKKLLKDPTIRINEISEKVGYVNLFHFSRAFKNYFGVSPNDFRKLK